MTTERTAPIPPTETGAAEGTPARTSTFVKHPTATDNHTAHRIVPLPIRWAKALIDAADGPVPEYGSPEWRELPDGAEKVASVVLSAERWRTRHYATGDAWTSSRRRSREIAEAQAARPGDHLGGAVEW